MAYSQAAVRGTDGGFFGAYPTVRRQMKQTDTGQIIHR